MSGAFGGHSGRKAKDFGTQTQTPSNQGFSQAQGAYSNPPPAASAAGLHASFWNTGSAAQSRVLPTAPVGPPVVKDPRNRKLSITAANAILVLLDATGSMGSWRAEIWARVATLLTEAQQYLGNDLQIVFGVFGDLKCGDRLEICDPAGDQPTLDRHLVALDLNMGGGGDEEESPEMMMYYLLEQVDVTTCRNVFAFFVTDEKAAPSIDTRLAQNHLGFSLAESLSTSETFRRLLLKMDAYIILKRTDVIQYNPQRIRDFWDKTTPERILPLDDGRRVVDVILAAVATKTGQMPKFSQNFAQRNAGNTHAAQNFQTVTHSVSFIGSAQPASPPPSMGQPSRLLASVTGQSLTNPNKSTK